MAISTELPLPLRWGERCAALSARINRVVELACALLFGVLVAIIWIGVFGRYVVDVPVTWTEELARYVMIWAALLAISCGVARREHVAVTAVLHLLAPARRRWVEAAIDLLALAFFAFLGYFGVDMARQGGSQYATIFDMTMTVPFASVSVSSALICLQLALTAVRDATGAGAPMLSAKEE